MSSSSPRMSPWPAQTPLPVPTSKRKRSSDLSLVPRQIADQGAVGTSCISSSHYLGLVLMSLCPADAMLRCQVFSGNYIISCFPTADTVVPQHQWVSFVCTFTLFPPFLSYIINTHILSFAGNSRRPELTQINRVDIFLFHADSMTQVLHFPDVINPSDQAGIVRAQVNDSWWGDNGSNWAGTNISYPFYWVIIRSDSFLDGSEIPQSIFTAVREYPSLSLLTYLHKPLCFRDHIC